MDRVRPSFMTKEQLNKYVTDAKHNRQPPARPNFELPTKRLSLNLTDRSTENSQEEEPKMEPLAKIQSETTASAFRRFGGSVRDTQKSKGSVRTRNGWNLGDPSSRPSPFGSRRMPTQTTILEDSVNASNIEKVEEKPIIAVHIQTKEVKDEDKENDATLLSESPIEEMIEDSITELHNDISQEIEAVNILLESPTEEKKLSPTVEDARDIDGSSKEESKPESPAPLKISRTLPVDIKPKQLHCSQEPERPIPVTNINKVQYQVNALPTPSSSPPELEKRPKFEDRGVPTFTPVAPPTPPTKVMILEDDKVVGEMTLDDGKDDGGYNVQQGKNPNAVVPSSEVSKIASRISELQLKADPYAAAPKPALPNITMEEFKERNDNQVAPVATSIPADPKPPQFAFNRTNSLPVNLASQNPLPSSTPAQKKVYEPPQYKPYRPPVQPTAAPLNNPNPPFLRTRTGSESTLPFQSFVPPPCPSPAPPSHASQFSRAIPPHVNNAHGRHSSLGNVYQPGQSHVQQGMIPSHGIPQHRQTMPIVQNQMQPIRHFQAGQPPLPSHGFHQPGPQNLFNRPSQNNFMQSNNVHSLNQFGATGRSLPAIPTEPARALPGPPVNIPSSHEPVAPRKPSPPVVATPPFTKQASPPIPTFSFDEVDTPTTRRLPATPTSSLQNTKPLPSAPLRTEESRTNPETKSMSPIPVFSFSDDSTPAPKNIPIINAPDDKPSTPSIPILNLPDDDDNDTPNPSIPTFSFAGPDESSDQRPLPTPVVQKQDPRPLPTPRGGSNGNSVADRRAAFETHGRHPNHRIPMTRSAASCTACGNHISARAVSASGLKFHPECFRCSHCSTRLEHVAFYPEPLGPDAGPEDGPTGRFYCHLDFHELFSPRCKSCKTPIEGEVVEACGATWHAGHFFCAECGDPFDAKSRFVEKDKYAWCLPCYQKRYSSKCKKCRKPVLDTVVKALDADWHMECFCCYECGSEFQDGRYFLRDGCKNEPVCTKCEETRLKSWELVQ
ncbi:hypothetical protein TWF694_005004 [Orbilia ellipsospora]|uniref:LIM zinc-binding domain-containing protein n=1 Tax=Orbilia ellipsospora TaxID=2528407 RepID=A0AAV9WVM9_9PEZI